MRKEEVRVGATVRSEKKGTGKIIKVEKHNNDYILRVKRADGVEYTINRKYPRLIKPPIFKDPVLLYVNCYMFESGWGAYTRTSYPASLKCRRNHKAVYFERESIQDIVDRLRGSNEIRCSRKDFFEIIRKIKNIYIGIT